jgi:hypothetical protein
MNTEANQLLAKGCPGKGLGQPAVARAFSSLSLSLSLSRVGGIGKTTYVEVESRRVE